MTAIATLLRLPFDGPVNGERLGRRMAALFRVWDGGHAPDLAELARDLLQPLGTMGKPMALACLDVASAVMRWDGFSYHSALHHAEVAINATVLAEIAAAMGQPVPSWDRTLLLTAALSHDYLYQAGAPFAAEQISADAMESIARHCGAGQQGLRRCALPHPCDGPPTSARHWRTRRYSRTLPCRRPCMTYSPIQGSPAWRHF